MAESGRQFKIRVSCKARGFGLRRKCQSLSECVKKGIQEVDIKTANAEGNGRKWPAEKAPEEGV